RSTLFPYTTLFRSLSRRSNERPADDVLLIAGLLADEQHARVAWPFAKHGLRRRTEQRATLTAAGFPRQRLGRAGLGFRQHDRPECRTIHRARDLIQLLRLG